MLRIVCTHHKCGSTWMRKVIHSLAEDRGYNLAIFPVSPAKVSQPVERQSDITLSILRGGVYKDAKDLLEGDYRIARIVRDPRDALISQYFSWRNSHKNNGPTLEAARVKLNELDQRDGLLWLIDEKLLRLSVQMRNWPQEIEAKTRLVKYENLLSDFVEEMAALEEHLDLPVDREEAARLEERFSFKNMAKRDAGDEEQGEHLRKGVAGDWRNHFDDRINERFEAVYGDFSRKLGYS